MRQFALLAVALHERPAHAVGDVPVNVPHLVAGDVFAQLLEIHAPAFEMAEIGADHRVVDQPIGAHLDAADGFEQFGDGHGVDRSGTEVRSPCRRDSCITAPARR